MSIANYISAQDAEREATLTTIHSIIVKEDKTVVPEIGTMMSKEMILYKEKGTFKYGLSSVKGHISIHMMPMYGSPELFGKFQKLLPKAKFQKGCINIQSLEDAPAAALQKIFKDCAKVSMVALMAAWEAKREK